MRELKDLINTDEPGISLVRDWASVEGANASAILPPDGVLRGQGLLRLQVTTRSILGALAYDTGGILIDGGRLRLLGSSTARSLLSCNEAAGGMRTGAPDDFVIVADDILGGLFALNGGRFGRDGLGNVFYLAVDQLVWRNLDVGYSDFVSWCLTGDLGSLYERFAAFHVFKLAAPPLEKVYSFYPYLWTREASALPPDARLIDADEGMRLRLEMAGFEAG